jgi:hypothetical protein
MASICDFTGSDGSVSRSQAESGIAAYNRGELSRSAAVELTAAYNTGDTISRCASGGGGSDPDPDPAPEPDPDPEPDRSELTARLDRVFSPARETVQVEFTVLNEITSGDGRQKTETAAIEIDGRTVETAPVIVPAGGSRRAEATLDNVTPGTREVCVRLQ